MLTLAGAELKFAHAKVVPKNNQLEGLNSETLRVFWRPFKLRGHSNEQTKEIFSRGTGTGRAHTFFLVSLMTSQAAFAVPVTWTFKDVYLDSGSQLTGSFVYDACTPEEGDICLDDPVDILDGPVYLGYRDFDIQFQSLQTNWSMNNENSYVTYGDDYGEHWVSGDDSVWFTCNFRECGDNPINPNIDIVWRLYLNFDEPLTNAGGEIEFVGCEIFYCFNGLEFDPYHSSFTFHDRIVSGSIVASVVPLPPAVWLFGSALAGLGWMRRKQIA